MLMLVFMCISRHVFVTAVHDSLVLSQRRLSAPSNAGVCEGGKMEKVAGSSLAVNVSGLALSSDGLHLFTISANPAEPQTPAVYALNNDNGSSVKFEIKNITKNGYAEAKGYGSWQSIVSRKCEGKPNERCLLIGDFGNDCNNWRTKNQTLRFIEINEPTEEDIKTVPTQPLPGREYPFVYPKEWEFDAVAMVVRTERSTVGKIVTEMRRLTISVTNMLEIVENAASSLTSLSLRKILKQISKFKDLKNNMDAVVAPVKSIKEEIQKARGALNTDNDVRNALGNLTNTITNQLTGIDALQQSIRNIEIRPSLSDPLSALTAAKDALKTIRDIAKSLTHTTMTNFRSALQTLRIAAKDVIASEKEMTYVLTKNSGNYPYVHMFEMPENLTEDQTMLVPRAVLQVPDSQIVTDATSTDDHLILRTSDRLYFYQWTNLCNDPKNVEASTSDGSQLLAVAYDEDTAGFYFFGADDSRKMELYRCLGVPALDTGDSGNCDASGGKADGFTKKKYCDKSHKTFLETVKTFWETHMVLSLCVIGGVVLLVVALITCCCCCKKKKENTEAGRRRV